MATEKSWIQYYIENQNSIRNIALSLSSDPVKRSYMLSELSLKVVKANNAGITAYRGRNSFLSWCRRTMLRKGMDYDDSGNNSPTSDKVFDNNICYGIKTSAHDEFSYNELIAQCEEIINEIYETNPHKMLRVFRAIIIEGMDRSDLALELNVTRSTIGNYLSEIRFYLQTNLEDF